MAPHPHPPSLNRRRRSPQRQPAIPALPSSPGCPATAWHRAKGPRKHVAAMLSRCARVGRLWHARWSRQTPAAPSPLRYSRPLEPAATTAFTESSDKPGPPPPTSCSLRPRLPAGQQRGHASFFVRRRAGGSLRRAQRDYQLCLTSVLRFNRRAGPRGVRSFHQSCLPGTVETADTRVSPRTEDTPVPGTRGWPLSPDDC